MRAWFVASMAILGCCGCSGQAFDPRGGEASVEAAWLVEGAAPTADGCAAIGVLYVRVRFSAGERTADHPDLVFPCELGSFDTRPEQVVAGGTWTMRLLGIDAEGNALYVGPEGMYSTAEGGHIVLGTVDLVAAP